MFARCIKLKVSISANWTPLKADWKFICFICFAWMRLDTLDGQQVCQTDQFFIENHAFVIMFDVFDQQKNSTNAKGFLWRTTKRTCWANKYLQWAFSDIYFLLLLCIPVSLPKFKNRQKNRWRLFSLTRRTKWVRKASPFYPHRADRLLVVDVFLRHLVVCLYRLTFFNTCWNQTRSTYLLNCSVESATSWFWVSHGQGTS